MGIAPLALADILLDEKSKRAGCMLVDLGAETTTMLVYHKNILRHIAVIPLGSNNITTDLTTLKEMDEFSVAERMKKEYGNAYYEQADETQEYPVDSQNSISSKTFQQVVAARTKEIVENVWQQVPLDYRGKLNGGIILTGGGSNLKGLAKAFQRKNETENISIVQFVPEKVDFQSKSANIPHDGTMNTLLGLLKKGELNCNGGELDNGLFKEKGKENEPANTGVSGETQGQTGTNTYGAGTNTGIKTPEEIAASAEQERKRDKDEWEKAKSDDTVEAYKSYLDNYPSGVYRNEANERITELNAQAAPKKGGWWAKLRDLGKTILTEPEE